MKFTLRTKLVDWIDKNRLEFVFLIIILSLGAFFRLYKIGEYMTFLGDEGRDAIIARKLLLGDLVFVGPGTSIGNMYLGPIYYYMMAPALLLANFNPVGPSIMVALLGVATIFMVWYVSRKWFPSLRQAQGKLSSGQANWGAIVAGSLYAVSPVIIIFTKHSWNPNIMPFFALLTVYSLWKVWYEENWKWLILAGLSFGAVLQSHYMGLLLTPLILIFWIFALVKLSKLKNQIKPALLYSLASIGLFFLLTSPLLMFDAKYNWRNITAVKEFFLERQGSLSFNPILSLVRIYPTWQLITTRLLAGKEIWIGRIVAIILLVFIGYIIYKLVKSKLPEITKEAFILLGSWLLIGLIGLSFYNQEIYDHYFGFLFPAPFILSGALIQIINNNRLTAVKVSAFIIIGIMLLVNLKNSPIKTPPGRQMQNTIEVAKKIDQEAKDEPYNFAVIADRNYEGAYQYFLELWNTKIIAIDPQRYNNTLANQLFVVCEYENKEKCQPASNPKAEIANFGWSKIDKSWVVDGVILYRMIHNWPYE